MDDARAATSVRSDLSGEQLRRLTLIPACIALNITMGQIVALLKVPLYLDSIGTVLVGALAGPAAGALTGVLANILWSILSNPTGWPFAVTAAAIGWGAGMLFKSRLLAPLPLTIAGGVLVGVVAAAISAPIAVVLYGGVTGGGTDIVVALFRATGQSALMSNLLQGLAVDPLDKALTFTLVWYVLRALPHRYLDRFR